MDDQAKNNKIKMTKINEKKILIQSSGKQKMLAY